jgi:uncharacterized DUF497 family protein
LIPISWNTEKNALLKAERGVSFEDVVFHIMASDIQDTVDHTNQYRYPRQQIHVISIEEYVYLVPFVETDEEVFLKTIISSRKATKSYLGEGQCANCRAKSVKSLRRLKRAS